MNKQGTAVLLLTTINKDYKYSNKCIAHGYLMLVYTLTNVN